MKLLGLFLIYFLTVCPNLAKAQAVCSNLFVELNQAPARSSEPVRDVNVIIEKMLARDSNNTLGPAADSRVASALDSLSKFGLFELDQSNGKIFRQSNSSYPFASFFIDLNYNEVLAVKSNTSFREQLIKKIIEQTDGNGSFRTSAGITYYGGERNHKHSALKDIGSLDYFSKNLILISRAILATDYISRISNTQHYLKESEFKEIAKIEQLQVKNFDGYRYDSRSPQEIIQEKGFYPNPDKTLAPLSMHSTNNSQGAAFVSLSLSEGNLHTAKLATMKAKVLTEKDGIAKDVFDELKQIQKSITNKTDIKIIYEYAIKDNLAATPRDEASIKEESEIVAPFVGIKHITAVRPVAVLSELVPNHNLFGKVDSYTLKATQVRFGEWMPLH